MTDATRRFPYALLLVVLFLGVRFVLFPWLSGSAPEPASEEKPVVVALNPFDTLALDAAAAYAVDLSTGEVLLSHNARAQLPLASLTKLMTALLAEETLGENTPVVIDSASLGQEGDQGLVAGERLRAGDLIDLTLVGSSNDGAHALASALGAFDVARGASGINSILERMNRRAEELGLEETYFANTTGLDIHEALVGGAYGSAADVSTLLAYIVREHPELLEPTRNSKIAVPSLGGIVHTIENTNEIADAIPWLVGSKTGFTDLAGGNLGVVFDAGLGRPVAAVVLGATKESRFTDIEKIVKTTFEYLSSKINLE